MATYKPRIPPYSNPDQLLTLQEVGLQLGRSPRWVMEHLIKSRLLPSGRIGSSTLVLQRNLTEFINRKVSRGGRILA